MLIKKNNKNIIKKNNYLYNGIKKLFGAILPASVKLNSLHLWKAFCRIQREKDEIVYIQKDPAEKIGMKL